MKNILFVILATLFPLIVNAQESGDGKKVVGIILPLTGKGASFGVAMNNGFRMAYESLPAVMQQRFELVIEDDGSESKNTISAYKKILASKPAVVFTALSNAGNALVPLTEADKMTHISFAVDRRISDGKQHAFTFWARLGDMADAALAEVYRRGYKKIAIISTTHEGNIAMEKLLAEKVQGKLDIVLQEELLPSDVDFSSTVAKLKSQGEFDVVANVMHPAQAGLFARAMAQKGISKAQFGLTNFEDKAVVRDAAGAAKGAWYTTAAYSEKFVSDYNSRFPGAPFIGAAYAYDALLMTVEALSSGQDLTVYLENLQNFKGAISGVSADGVHGFKVPVKLSFVE